jgi:hypothetical protein
MVVVLELRKEMRSAASRAGKMADERGISKAA